MTTLIAPVGITGIVQGRSGTNYTIGADGSITSVAGVDVLPLIQAGWNSALALSRSHFIEAALPADLISIKAAATPANGAIVIAAQPPHPRKFQVRIVIGTTTTTAITAGTLTLVGKDQDGNAITEVISLIANASVTLKTTYAYASLTSGTVAGYVASGSGTGNTLGLGGSNDFGVPTVPGVSGFASNLACVKATRALKVLGTSIVASDDVAATTVVDGVARTIAPTTAPAAAGLTDYSFNYTFLAAA